MKKQIIFSILCFCAVFASAQPKNNWCTADYRRVGKRIMMEQSVLNVEYAFCADDVTKESTYIDKQWLQVGKTVTKYCSKFLADSDVKMEAWWKAHPHPGGVPRILGEGGKKSDSWSEYEYSELYFRDGTLTLYSEMPMAAFQYNSWYTEPRPTQPWILTFEMTEILGHSCQKATCRWRGRDYVAWFAPDIPSKTGPWKFGGLPGCILRLEDSTGLYRWEAVAISTKPTDIWKYEYKEFSKSTREKVLKLWQKYNEDWAKAIGIREYVGDDSKGEPIWGAIRSVYKKYEPLEKE